MSAEYASLMGDVARQLRGEPNARLSTAGELRYGSNGSLSIDLHKGTWFDHEADQGGGVLDFVTRETGREDGKAWLKEQGYPVPDVTPTVPTVEYVYRDEHGAPLYRVVRTQSPSGKRFHQGAALPDGGWRIGKGAMGGVRRVPYRLPELVARPDELVFVAEGEKDVDNLLAVGLLATCNEGGAESWRRTHAEALQGRRVVILPDNDEPGRKHAQHVLRTLDGIAADARIVELPDLPEKGDVTDWLTAGGTPEALLAMVADTITPSQLREVPLGDVMDTEPQAPGFIITPIVPRRVATLMGGHGGVGKSMLGLTLCAHVACGRAWGPFTTDQARAVFVSLEDEGQVVRYRLRRIIEAYQLPVAVVLANLRVVDGSDVEAALMVEANAAGVTHLVETPMMLEVERAAQGAGLVMVDNASDAYAGNENARLQVRGFMRRLARVARANDAGLVLLAHIDKAAAKHGGRDNNYSGSTAWHNSARSRVAIVDGEDGIELRHEKANWGQRAEPVRLTRGNHGVLEPIAPGGLEVTAALVASTDADTVLGILQIADAAGVVITTAQSGPCTTWHALCRMPELGPMYRTKDGRRRVEAAIVALQRAGRIAVATYTKPNRHKGERWALAQIGGREAA